MLPQSLTEGFEGREHWWPHSILFPDDYVNLPASTQSAVELGVVFDFHNTASGPWQANFHVDAMPATAIFPDCPLGLRFRGYGGVNSGDGEFTAPIRPIVRNVWAPFRLHHVNWSSGSDGFFKAWVTGC